MHTGAQNIIQVSSGWHSGRGTVSFSFTPNSLFGAHREPGHLLWLFNIKFMSLVDKAADNLNDILKLALEHSASRPAIVVFDTYSQLSTMLTEAYRRALPEARFIDFDQVKPAEILVAFEDLAAGDLVVLVQSMSFRLNQFRIRVELFKQGLKVIEHAHLARMRPDELEVYIDALAYDPQYYRVVGPKLKHLIDRAKLAVVSSGQARLRYESAFEDTKLNIGDYTGMRNVGGQFPIGEVFTEPKNLEGVNGEVEIFAFGDTSFSVNVPTHPITLVIRRGQVVEVHNTTPEFDRVLEQIRAEEAILVRELGFGMNRAFSRERRVLDVGTYERMCGIHISLGAKHSIYAKPGLKRRAGRYHVDVFVKTDQVSLDDTVVYNKGAWVV